MEIGLHALGIGAGARGDVVRAVAVAAEECGFATLWSGEHVVGIEQPGSRYPYSADGRIAVPADADWNDPVVTLSFAAAATASIRIATGILLLPEHNPLMVAKQAATLDSLSGGRLALGIGIGWSRDEFSALGVPFGDRAARSAEYVRVLRALWSGAPTAFAGDFLRFEPVIVRPQPARGSIPILVGGNSDAALERVARWGDGWYGFNLDSAAAAVERVDRLRALCARHGTDFGRLRVAVALRTPQIEDLSRLQGAGVQELVLVDGPPDDPDRASAWVHELAGRWLPARGA